MIILYLTFLTNRFHFCVRLYCYRSQMTSWHVKNKKVRHEKKSGIVTFCSSHTMTSSVIYYSTEAQKNEMYLFYIISKAKTRKNILLKRITPLDDVICACVP